MRIPTDDDFAKGMEILVARPDCEQACEELACSEMMGVRAQHIMEEIATQQAAAVKVWTLLCHHFAAAMLIGFQTGVQMAQEEQRACKPTIM